MKKKYKIKKTQKLIKQLQPYWQQMDKLTDIYHKKLYNLEKRMEIETGIEGIEFYWGDNSTPVGIGNINRDMELIHDQELEEGKLYRD